MRMPFPALLAVAAVLSAPALAQTGATTGAGTNPTIRQPTGAAVPDPSAITSSNLPDATPAPTDPAATGTIRSRDTTGMRQSPEERNALGCRQIDPLCQSGR